MICKVSLSIYGRPADTETSVTCQLTGDEEECGRPAAGQLRRLQEACLAAVCSVAGLAPDRPANERGRPAKATPTLRQLARLYRAAANVASFDLAQLQGLSQRLYQKPVAGLSAIEVGGLAGTLKAVVKGMFDVRHVRSETVSNGQPVA